MQDRPASRKPRFDLKLKILRQGKTQRQLAYQVGIPESRLSEILNGWRLPTAEQIRRLESALNFGEGR